MKHLRILALALVALALFAAAGCGDDSSSDTGISGDRGPDATAKVGATTVVSTVPLQIFTGPSSESNITKPTVYAVRTRDQFNEMLNTVGSKDGDQQISIPDFSKRQLVVVALPATDLSTQLAISTVAPASPEEMTVKAVRLPAGKGCKKGEAVPGIYTVVETDVIPGEPNLKLETQRQSAC